MLPIKHDMHIHTFASTCCLDERQTIDNIVLQAQELGLERIGLADHVWDNPNLVPNDFYKEQGKNRCINLKRSATRFKNSDIDVLVGCEVETVAPKKFSITEELANELDFVLLATDHFHLHDLVAQPKKYKPKHFAKHMIEMYLGGIRCPFGDIMAHPFLAMGYYEIYEEIIESISDRTFIEVFQETAESGKAVEITTHYLGNPTRRRLFSRDIPIRILSLALEAGCKFVFSSDAHQLESIGRVLELKTLAVDAGIREENIHKIALRG
ncbi:MAG: PHP domain-containing protein [Lentisphaerae bacterium]|nr:PHP domain-containing protein [Lentisphaerota bacterium]MCP4100924.1 PHP domain-containing protein [Lentisphaerota bacterium]